MVQNFWDSPRIMSWAHIAVAGRSALDYEHLRLMQVRTGTLGVPTIRQQEAARKIQNAMKRFLRLKAVYTRMELDALMAEFI